MGVTPSRTPADESAKRQGWTAGSAGRSFRVQHWEYDADRLDGFDYDIGAVLVRSTVAADELELVAALVAWQLRPTEFGYPRDTDDPR